MKRPAVRTPNLDIFTSAYVLRDTNGWQMTDAGRQFSKWMEVQTGDAGAIPGLSRWTSAHVPEDPASRFAGPQLSNPGSTT